MKIDETTVDKIAGLAKLSFDGDQKEEIISDMNNMLAFISKLEEVNTDGVEPLIHITSFENVLREDDAYTFTTQEEALKNAPAKDATYFRMPKVIE